MKFRKALNENDLENLDLVDRYDDPLSGYRSLTWRSFTLFYVVVLGLLALFVWASLAEVSELTRAEARIIPSSEIQIIQNLEGGIVEEFLVEEGDTVSANDVILRMSNVAESGEVEAGLQKLYLLEAQISRLNAEISNQNINFSAELMERAPSVVSLERSSYDANRRQFDSQSSILERQLEQNERNINEIDQQIAGLQRLLKLGNEELNVIEPLVETGAVSKVELLQTRSRVEAQKAEIESLKANRLVALASRDESADRLSDQRNAYNARLQQELSEKSNEFATLSTRLAEFQDRSDRRLLRTPVDGVVNDLKVSTVGGVVQPGETIAEIVPSEDNLIVQASVRPSDIAFIYPGQEAIIKITAYDYTIYGTLKGYVQSISADSFENENGETFYRVRLKSDDKTIKHDGESLPIIPGMVAQVDIVTGKRTVLNYLLKPFKKTLSNAMTER